MNPHPLAIALNYEFLDEKLLNHSLTHKSFGKPNNERFEFLGDSLLNFVIAETLYNKYRTKPEGELTRLRAHLVKGDTLAKIANEISLGQYLNLGEGEIKSGGRERPSILADAVEAIIAAIYLEAGFNQCRDTVLHLFRSRLTEDYLAKKTKDAKTQLQELLQGSNDKLPIYEIVKEAGKQHDRTFTVACRLSDGRSTEASEKSKKRAEQTAAQLMLSQLEQTG